MEMEWRNSLRNGASQVSVTACNQQARKEDDGYKNKRE